MHEPGSRERREAELMKPQPERCPIERAEAERRFIEFQKEDGLYWANERAKDRMKWVRRCWGHLKQFLIFCLIVAAVCWLLS